MDCEAGHAVEGCELPITAVEVFRDAALVTRSGPFAAKEGDGGELTLTITGLPLGLLDSSLRVELSDPRYRLREVRTLLDARLPAGQGSHGVERELRANASELELVDQRRAFLQRQVEQLGALQPRLPHEPERADIGRYAADDPVRGWLSLFEARDLRVSALLEQLAEADRQRQGAIERRRALENEAARLSSQDRGAIEMSKTLHIVLVGEGHPGEASRQIALSYLIRGAFWVPTYELRIDSELKGAELKMHALLAQRTGEDWSQVALRLSTADVQRESELPQLGAFRVGRAIKDERPRAWRPLPADLDELFADYQRAVGKASSPPPAPALPAAEPEDAFGSAAPADSMASCDEGAPEAPMMAAPAPGLLLASLGGAEHHELARQRSVAPAKRAKAAPPAPEVAAGPGAAGGPSHLTTSIEPDGAALGFAAVAMNPADDALRGRLMPLPVLERLPEAQRTPAVRAAYERKVAELAAQSAPLRQLPLPTHTQRVEQSAGHYAYRYHAAARATLPSDGELHRVAVFSQEVQLSISFATVPRHDSAVYRQARLNNPLSQPLLAGPLDVFIGNDYLSTTPLATAPAGALIEPALGVEPRIKVARNVTHRQREAGFLSSKTVYEDEVRIALRNGLAHSASVRVLEQLPVTKEKKLEVELLAERPAAAPYTQQERGAPIHGGRCFELEVPAGAEAQCLLHYALSLPEKSEIIGGGRRA